MKALVLAAGCGSRLRPLTDTQPKPLVPICGRPCLEVILDWLAAAGLRDVGINTHWLPQPLHDHLGDGARFGLQLHWQHEPELLDGCGTLKSFEWLWGDDTVVCVNGDIVFDFPLEPILETHRRHGAALTLAVAGQVGPLIHPVLWDDDGRLRGIRRSGLDDPAGRWAGVFTGVQVLEPEIWRRWLPAGRPYHLTLELMPRLLAQRVPVACHLVDGAWADIGTLESLDRARAMVLDQRCRRYLAAAVERDRDVWTEPEVTIAGTVRPPVYLGRGVRVAPDECVGPYQVVLAR